MHDQNNVFYAIALSAVADFQALPGLGAEAMVDGTRVVIGNHRLFDERGACSAEVHARIEAAALAARGQTLVIVGAEAPIGTIGVSDRPRESAPRAPAPREAAHAPRAHAPREAAHAPRASAPRRCSAAA